MQIRVGRSGSEFVSGAVIAVTPLGVSCLWKSPAHTPNLFVFGTRASSVRSFRAGDASRSRPPAGHQRNRFYDLVVPGLAFLFCLAIWLSLPKPAIIVGGLWCAAGIFYTAIKTRGFRRAPVMLDLSGT